jgi:type IV pilus assembly protein PilW
MRKPSDVRQSCRRMGGISHGQAGLTIVELMVAITVGLLVVLAATALLLSTKTAYLFQDEGARLQETGRYAIDSITRTVRQAGYENWDSGATAILMPPEISANIAGLDASSLKERDIGMDAPLSKSVNGSDVLAVRFVGSGTGAGGDGTLLNCAGFGVAAPIDLEADRGWSIFYIATDKSGEPELRCKYFGKTSWNTEAIARGIESFQVLYGVDTDADGVPNQFFTATAINKLDSLLVLEGPNVAMRALDKNRRTHWKMVVTIKIAMLVRSGSGARADAQAHEYDLFGKDYADLNAATDIGTRVDEVGMPAATHSRHRKVFASTIQLRNRVAGSGV